MVDFCKAPSETPELGEFLVKAMSLQESYQLSLLQRLATVGWDASLESRGTWGSILMEALAVRFSVFQAKDVTTFSQRLLLSCEIVIRSSLLPVVHRWIMIQKVRHFGDNQHAQWSSSSYLALHMRVTRSSCQQCSTPWRRQDDIWRQFFTGFERAVEDDCSFSSPERHGTDWLTVFLTSKTLKPLKREARLSERMKSEQLGCCRSSIFLHVLW